MDWFLSWIIFIANIDFVIFKFYHIKVLKIFAENHLGKNEGGSEVGKRWHHPGGMAKMTEDDRGDKGSENPDF